MTAERVGRALFEIAGDLDPLRRDLATAEGEIRKSGMSAEAKLKAAATGVGVALGGLAVAALKVADRYDDAVDRIRIGTAATGEDLAALEASFQRVAKAVPDDIEVVAQTLADLHTRTGQTGEGLERLTEQVLDLSRITRTDAATNVAAVTRLFGDWSVATDDQAGTLDKLLRTSQATGVGVDQLALKVVAFGAPLRALGIDLDTGLSLLGKWEQEGVNVETVLTGMRMAVANFAKAGIDPREGLPALIEKIGTLDDAQGLLAAKQIVGQRAANDFFRAVKEGRFDVAELMAVVQDGSDTITTATQDTEGLGEAFRQFKNTVSVVAGPVLRDFAGIGTELGNLVYLLPALGGLLGRGLAVAWLRVGRPALTAAIAAAGAAAGVAYRAAAFVAQAFTDGVASVWTAIGRPGSRVIGAAIASGRLTGLAFAAAAAAAVLAIPLLVTSDQAPKELTRVRDLKRAIADLEMVPPDEQRGIGTAADLLKILSAELAAVEAGNIAVADAVRDGTIGLDGLDAALAGLAVTAPQATDALTETGAGIAGLGDAAPPAAAEVEVLREALQALAGSGFKDVRESANETRKALREAFKAPSSLQALIKQENELIAARRKALRLKDEDAFAIAEVALAENRAQQAHFRGVRARLQAILDDRKARRDAAQAAAEASKAARVDFVKEQTALGLTTEAARKLWKQTQKDHGIDIPVDDSELVTAKARADALIAALRSIGPTPSAAGPRGTAYRPKTEHPATGNRDNIPGRRKDGARGATYYPGDYGLVGELGPERIANLGGATVVSPMLDHRKTMQLLAGGAGGGQGGGGASTVIEQHFHIDPTIHGTPLRAETPSEIVQAVRRAARMGVLTPRQASSWRRP